MVRFTSALPAILVAVAATADAQIQQPPELSWALQIPYYDGYAVGRALAVNPQTDRLYMNWSVDVWFGGLLHLGWFSSLREYDRTGNPISVVLTATHPTHADAWGIALEAGSLYTVGDFFPGASADPSFHIARFDAHLNPLWNVHHGSTSKPEHSRGVAVNEFFEPFVAGSFDGGLGTPNPGSLNAVVMSYDAFGFLQWSRELGTPGIDEASAICIAPASGLFVTGTTSGDLAGTNAGFSDIFVARLTQFGDILWVRQLGTSGEDMGLGVATTSAGDVIVCGNAAGSLGGLGGSMLAKYSSGGELLWVRQFGSAADIARAIVIDEEDNIFFVGKTWGDFGGTNKGGSDAYLAKCDADGNLLWAKSFGTSTNDGAFALATDDRGGVYVSGETYGSLFGTKNGFSEAFLACFNCTCYADCDGGGSLDFFDFLCFQNEFANGTAYADCDGSGTLDFFDFLCFQNAFAAGCP